MDTQIKEKNFPVDMFLLPYFPNCSLGKVALTQHEIIIEVEDSVWGPQNDFPFFDGPGIMIFSFDEMRSLLKRAKNTKEWVKCLEVELLTVHEFESVLSLDKGIAFRFRQQSGASIEILVGKIVQITWLGNGIDIEPEDIFLTSKARCNNGPAA